MANEKAGVQQGSASWVLECVSARDNSREGRRMCKCVRVIELVSRMEKVREEN